MANDWLVAYARDFTSGPPTATSGSTLDIANGTQGIYSQGPYASTGANSIKYTPTGNHVNDNVYAAFSPVASGGASVTYPYRLTLMGVQ